MMQQSRSLPLHLFFVALLTLAADARADVSVSATPSICGRPTGTVSASASGGVPPYTYLWSNGASGAYLSGLNAGMYSVTATDSQGAEFTGQGEVLYLSEYPPATLYADQLMQSPDQPAMAYVYTGMGIQGVDPDWSDPHFGPNPYNFTAPGLSDVRDVAHCWDPTGNQYRLLLFDQALAGTTQMVDYTDNYGCPGQLGVQIAGPVVWPTVQATNVVASCQNFNTGSISLSLQAENTPSYFSIRYRKDGTSDPCPFDQILFTGGYVHTHTFSNLSAGDYWIITSIGDQRFDWIPAVSDYFTEDSILVNVPLDPVDCGIVTGRLYVDNNSNCVMNTGENRIPSAVIEFTPGPHYATTNSTGYYRLTLPYGTYTATEQHPVYEQSCPSTVTITTGNTQTRNVGCAGGQALDVRASMTSGFARPGFQFVYGVALDNLTDGSTGTVTMSMTIDPLLSFVSSSPSPTSVIGNVITWSSSQVTMNLPFQHRNIWVRTQVPPDPLLIGTTLNSQVTVSTQNTDTDLSNNTASSAQIITGSYDPNDKLASTTGGSDATYYLDADDWIDYTLRFQNTGNDTAFNVVVTDTLPATLNPGSILWGATSHVGVASVSGDGVVKYIFENIQLPDSGANEAGSHGFASFRIKPVNGLSVGTNITNEANIFFDFNPPIITDPSVLVTALTPVRVALKVMLGGAYETGTGLMADDLRTDVLIPLAQPYTSIGYSSASPSADIISNGTVLATTGNDAIVDWVVVELRDATTPSLVLWSRYALVQRDGDVVDLDGTSALRFGAVPGSYHVAVRHRNHLGVMTATPLAFSAASPLIDFTQPGTATWGVDARVDMAGTMALWNGDITFNGQVKYTGEANDRDAILQAIGGTVPTATITGRYLPEDVNLDGEVKYTGARNDRDLILQTIGGTVPTNVRYEQVP